MGGEKKNHQLHNKNASNCVVNRGRVQMLFLIVCFHTQDAIHFSTSHNEGCLFVCLFLRKEMSHY